MATKYKVILQYMPFEAGDILELTGDGKAYTNGYSYINKHEVENNPRLFERIEATPSKPLTADSFFGEPL